MTVEDDQVPPQDAPTAARKKQPKQQLSKGMEHMRHAVTLPDQPANLGLPAGPRTTTLDNQADQADPAEESAYGVPAHHQPIRAATNVPATDANPQKRVDPFTFGSRILGEGDDIFAYNAWDHVATDAEYDTFVTAQTDLQRSSPVSDYDKHRFNSAPEKWWDKFYSNNGANFFKDRRWLGQEFPLLTELTAQDYGKACTVLEVGAGAGNTAFPIVAMSRNAQLRVHACDYSRKAVEVMRGSPLYDERVMRADVWDVAHPHDLPPGLGEGSVDVVILIFIFSALAPAQWQTALRNVWRLLKPGGAVLFRDYGRGDLAQVRFKKGRYLEENFYVRGDGTRVYFFDEEELKGLWSGRAAGPSSDETKSEDDAVASVEERLAGTALGERPEFEIVQLGTDRRMLVNRQRRLKMYRCWMQGLFRKPIDASG